MIDWSAVWFWGSLGQIGESMSVDSSEMESGGKYSLAVSLYNPRPLQIHF